MTIEELQNIVCTFRDERDRKQFHNPKDLAEAIVIEAGELLEHFLRKSQADSYDIATSQECLDEFADVMNYLLLYADVNKIDIAKAVIDKVEKNRKKYPVEKTKGKSEKYTKL